MAVLPNHVIAQVVLPRTSGLPRDVVTNTFHFLKSSGTSFDDYAALVGDWMEDFYENLTSPATQFPVAWFINATISRSTPVQVNCYNGAIAPGARTPVTTTFTLDAGASSNALPDEMSCCLSFKCTNTTIPFSHQRGRVYIGPLNYDAVAAVSAGDVRPDATFASRMLDAGQRLADFAKAEDSFWGIYSPTSNAMNRVEGLWVDNAFDVQRRRGAAPSSRVTRTVEYP